MSETNLGVLIKNMNPSTDGKDYVFCTIKSLGSLSLDDIIGSIRETEWITLILKKETADAYALEYNGIFGWITLNIESSLEAIGLTAAFSRALSEENISANVMAWYYHDHIFVQKSLLEKSVSTLIKLSQNIQ